MKYLLPGAYQHTVGGRVSVWGLTSQASAWWLRITQCSYGCMHAGNADPAQGSVTRNSQDCKLPA